MALAIKIDRSIQYLIANIEERITINPFTKVYGVARSIIALGTFLTLAFNPTTYLFIATNFTQNHHDFLKTVNLFFLLGYSHLVLAKTISIAILLFVISGYIPQLSGILHWWVSFSFFNSAVIVDGGDQVSQVLTFLLLPVCLLDNRFNHWLASVPTGRYRRYLALLAILFIKIQVAVIYFNAAVAKFNVPEWLNGTAIYYWLSHNTFGPPQYIRQLSLGLINSPVLVLLVTWGTIVFEILLFVAVFLSQRKRVVFLKLGILFHFLIFVLLGLASFFFAMTGALILYLYFPGKTQANGE